MKLNTIAKAHRIRNELRELVEHIDEKDFLIGTDNLRQWAIGAEEDLDEALDYDFARMVA